MTNVIVLIVTTLITAGYAALMSMLADVHPELAALGALLVVAIWLVVGWYFL